MARDPRKLVKMSLAGLVARRVRRPRIDAATLRALDPRRVLIVRQHNQMGDMVCATPTFRAIRACFPGAVIGLICAPLNHDVVRHNPDLDRIFLFDKRACRRPGPLRALVRELRGFCPDLAIVLNSVSFSVTSAALAHLSGAPLIVGGDSRPFGWDVARQAYSLVLPCWPVVDRHAVAHSLAPLEAVGIGTDDLRTVMVPSRAEVEEAARLRAEHGLEGPFRVLHPGAGKRDNLWPAERFAEVALRAAAGGRKVAVLQGPADGEALAAFRGALAAAPGPARAVAILPVVRVGVCAALLVAADRFLCNDTGLLHVAGAVGTPTLALFGPTDPALWCPAGGRVVALRDPSGRLDALSTEQVAAAWEDLGARAAI